MGHEDEDLTVVELLSLARERIEGYQIAAKRQLARHNGEFREYSLALIALEDAGMRFTRARAMAMDCFQPADLEKIERAAA